MFASEVLSTFDSPTIALVIPLTVPVNVQPDRFALDAKSVTRFVICDSVKTLDESAVLLTFPKPIIDGVIPLTVPVKVHPDREAFDASAVSTSVFVYVVDWLAFDAKSATKPVICDSVNILAE